MKWLRRNERESRELPCATDDPAIKDLAETLYNNFWTGVDKFIGPKANAIHIRRGHPNEKLWTYMAESNDYSDLYRQFETAVDRLHSSRGGNWPNAYFLVRHSPGSEFPYAVWVNFAEEVTGARRTVSA